MPSTNYGYNGVGARTSKSNSTGSRTYKRNGVGVTAPVLSDGVATMVPGVAEKSGGVTNTVLTDRVGSTKAISSSGTATFTADYDAFGKVVSTSGSTTTQKGFAGGFGYQEDGESSYKLLGHRYYDADSGRFLSRDNTLDGANWYAYCQNNPLVKVDSTGHSWVIVAIIVIAIGGVIVSFLEGKEWAKKVEELRKRKKERAKLDNVATDDSPAQNTFDRMNLDGEHQAPFNQQRREDIAEAGKEVAKGINKVYVYGVPQTIAGMEFESLSEILKEAGNVDTLADPMSDIVQKLKEPGEGKESIRFYLDPSIMRGQHGY